MANFLGRVQNKFIERLGQDFVFVANVLEIPHHNRAAWVKGLEGDGIWAYLVSTDRLPELPKALKEANRPDLAALLRSSLVSLDSEVPGDSPPVLSHGLSPDKSESLRMGLSSATGLQAAVVFSSIANATLSGKEFIARYERASLSVCSIGSDSQHVGTGFLVASDRILTNYHVWDAARQLGSKIFAKFEPSPLNPQFASRVEIAMNSPLALSVPDRLDYAILQLEVAMGSERKPFELVTKVPRFRETLNLLGYPTRQDSTGQTIVNPPQSLSAGVLFDHNAQSHRLAYSAETAPGSSGSPVLLSSFELIAIHHHGQAAMNNHGICIQAIIQDLDSAGKLGLVTVATSEEPVKSSTGELQSADIAPLLAQTPPTNRDELITRFREGRVWIGYMHAYKGLHDTLHNLQGSIGQIEREAIECQSTGTQIRETTAKMLSDFVTQCWKGVEGTETAKKPTIQRWIRQLEDAVRKFFELKGVNQIRSLDRIRIIPDQQLARLNEELVACANRLNVALLCQIIDGLTGLHPDEQQAIQRFRGPCGELQGMIEVHNRCQTIQEELRFITGSDCMGIGFAEMLDPLIAKLSELSRSSLSDPSIFKTERAAATLRSLPSEMALDDLKDKFDNMFLRKDEALLKVISKILLAQVELSDALGES
jgi:V8-like Glu-specific endopeptidase